MIDPQDNTQFKADIALRIAKMKERRRGEFVETYQKNGKTWIKGQVVVKDEDLEKEVRDLFYPEEKNIVAVQVDKPLVRNSRPWFNLNKGFILKAQREGKLMRITWPDGSALHKPEDWLKTGTPYQKAFNFADRPMDLIGNFLDLE